MVRMESPGAVATWMGAHLCKSLQTDSRKIEPGDAFIAWPGTATDGRRYVSDAFARGALVCIVEESGADAFRFNDDRILAYPGLKSDAGKIASTFFEQPTQQIDVLAVTGTNGKTSTAWWLAQALSGLPEAYKCACAMVGTLGVGRPPSIGMAFSNDEPQAGLVLTGLTTPDPVLLQQKFRDFVDQGFKACVIEASSIGIEEHRLAGTTVRTAIFTNFTQDHLDYHKTMDAYWLAKQALFEWPGLVSAVINLDDPKGDHLVASLPAGVTDVWTVSCERPARLRADSLHYGARGLDFVVTEELEKHSVSTSLIGKYNVSNLLGVIATMRSLGVPLKAVVDVCQRLTSVPGRMECLGEPGQPLVVVDYAHTPDALEKALGALHALAEQRHGEVWCVFGCGGDRDAAKRPLMGSVAARHADHVVITSDNPRGENPQAIIDQILPGILRHGRARAQPDRAQAISQSIANAHAQDVVLVAGKGHETYQEVAGVRLPFSDFDQVKNALALWNSGRATAGALA